jgi:prepilin-type N-terminal cleavage/methylation domain-containing protein
MLNRVTTGYWLLAVSGGRYFHQALRFRASRNARVKIGLGRLFSSGFMPERSGRIPIGVKAQKGFTLLETIVAVALAGLALGVLTQVFVQSTYTQRQLAGRVMAVVLGTGKLGELACRADTSNSGVFPAPYQQYHWSFQTTTLDNGVEAQELVVEWSEINGPTRRKTLRQYRLAQ